LLDSTHFSRYYKACEKLIDFFAGSDYVKTLLKMLLSLALIMGLSACSEKQTPENTPADWLTRSKKDAAQFAEIYKVTEDNPFLMATYEEMVAQLEYGTGLIVFGFPDCPRCQNAFPVLEKAFKEMKMDLHAGYRGKILYYDIYDDRAENNERYQTFVGYLEEFLGSDDSGNPRIFVPDIFFINSGTVVGNHLDTVESQTNPRDLLSDEQKSELMGIYMDLILEMENCEC